MINHALKKYPEVMESLICWAELVIKKMNEAPDPEEVKKEQEEKE